MCVSIITILEGSTFLNSLPALSNFQRLTGPSVFCVYLPLDFWLIAFKKFILAGILTILCVLRKKEPKPPFVSFEPAPALASLDGITADTGTDT